MKLSSKYMVTFLLGLGCAQNIPADTRLFSKDTIPNVNISAGGSASLSLVGMFAEARYRNLYAAQIQYYRYNEFQGIFPASENLPYEKYGIGGVNVGFCTQVEHLKVGIFSGLNYAAGVTRGNFIRAESVTGWFDSYTGDTTSYYEPIHLHNLVVPLKLECGLVFGPVGVTVTPQFYFSGKPVFGNVAFNIEMEIL